MMTLQVVMVASCSLLFVEVHWYKHLVELEGEHVLRMMVILKCREMLFICMVDDFDHYINLYIIYGRM